MAAFEIDGRDYPIPSVFQLTMGEAQTLYDYSGYTLEDFVPPLPDQPDDKRIEQLRNPAFKRAMVHIAYQRGNPDTPKDEVGRLVDGVQMFDMVAAMYGDEDTDPTPDSPNQPSDKSEPTDTTNGQGSGSPSTISSGQQDETPSIIGTTG